MNTIINSIQKAYTTHISSKENLKSVASERLIQIRKEVNALHAEESSLEDMLSDLNLK